MKLLCGILLGCAIVHAGPLPACGSQFQYSCASPTLGGYTIITPLSGIGSTEITGFNSSNAVVFDQIIPIPPTGPAGSDVQNAVYYADAQLALQSGQESTLPSCTSIAAGLCLGSNPGLAYFTSGFSTPTYAASDTPVTQQVNQFSTTLIAALNGTQVFSETFGAPFSDPVVQAGVSLADALLNGDGALFDSPVLASESTSPLGSQLTHVQTGEQLIGPSPASATPTFGPVFVIGCATPSNCVEQYDLTFILSAQLNISAVTYPEVAINRNVITTNTFLTTQTYEIDGSTQTSAVPEPATWGLMLAGALAIAIRKIRRSR